MAAVLLVMVAVEGASLTVWATYPYWLTGQGIALLEKSIFNLLAPFSPILLTGLLYAWIPHVAVVFGSRRSGRFKCSIRLLLHPFSGFRMQIQSVGLKGIAEQVRVLSRPRVMLAIGVVSSGVLAYEPYRFDLNPSGSLVGIDTPLYADWVGQMLRKPVGLAFQYAFQVNQGSRPAFLILLYLVAVIGGIEAGRLIMVLPLALGPLLCLSSYTFVKLGEAGERLAGLTALMTAFSFNLTVGMWAGFYANWFGLVEGYFFFAILLAFVRSYSPVRFLGLLGVSAALLLTHPWTWVLILSVSLLFVFTLWVETRVSYQIIGVFLVVAIGLGIDFLKNLIFGAMFIGADLETKVAVVGLPDILSFWPNLYNNTFATYGGLLGYSILVSLGVLSLAALSFKNRFERLLLLWVGVSSVPFAFFNSFHQTRIIYDLPLPILASAGLLLLLWRARSSKLKLSVLLLLLIAFFSANYALRSVLTI